MSECVVIGFGPRGREWAEVAGSRFEQVTVVEPDAHTRDEAQAAGYRPAADLDAIGEADLAVVATPPDAHVEVACALMGRVQKTLIEKPVALSAADVDRLIASRDREGAWVGVVQNFRTRPLTDAIGRGIGSIGAVERATTVVSRPETGVPAHNAKLSHAAIWDFGIHFIDLHVQRMGAPASAVRALRHGPGGGRTYDMVFSWPDATWTFSLGDSRGLYSLYEWIEGRESAVRVVDNQVWLVSSRHRPRRIKLRRSGSDSATVLESAMHGGGPGVATVEEAADVVRMIEAAIASAEAGGSAIQLDSVTS